MLAAIPIVEALLALADKIPELMQAGQTVVTLLKENRDPTPDEQAQFDAALAAADAALPEA